MPQQSAADWINQLNLEPHPEGGFYKEVLRSQQYVSRVDSNVVRHACTAIYYLLEGKDYSGFHRIKSDEIWFFHKGVSLYIHIIGENGEHQVRELSDLSTGNLSLLVPAGLWFAAEIPSKADYALVSCAVAPGFEFSEFEMARKEDLLKCYPIHADLIDKLCR